MVSEALIRCTVNASNYTIEFNPPYDTTISGGASWNAFVNLDPKAMRQAQIRERFRHNLSLNVRKTTHALDDLMRHNMNDDEERARTLLKSMISTKQFKQYLRRGFFVTKGKSGMLYRIFGGHEEIKSYVREKDGKYRKFESICIVFEDMNMPHTDWAIMRFLLIENDEFGMRKLANIRREDKNYRWPEIAEAMQIHAQLPERMPVAAHAMALREEAFYANSGMMINVG